MPFRLLQEEAAKRAELEQMHLQQQRALSQTEAEKQELVAEQLAKERELQTAMLQLERLQKERKGALEQYEVRSNMWTHMCSTQRLVVCGLIKPLMNYPFASETALFLFFYLAEVSADVQYPCVNEHVCI